MSRKSLRTPIYDATKDGNVFHWIIQAAQDHRKIKQRERYIALEKLATIQKPNDNHRHKYI